MNVVSAIFISCIFAFLALSKNVNQVAVNKSKTKYCLTETNSFLIGRKETIKCQS